MGSLSGSSVIILASVWKDRVLETWSFYVSSRKLFVDFGDSRLIPCCFLHAELKASLAFILKPSSAWQHLYTKQCAKPPQALLWSSRGYLVCWGYLFRPQEDPSSMCSDHAIGWSTEMIFRVSGHDWARRSWPSVFWASLSLENCLIKGGIPGRFWRGEHGLALFAFFLHNISDSPRDQTPNRSNLVG